MIRSVAFINIPAFLIELQRLKDSSLRKRPVAVIQPGERFSRLHMLSQEAYQEGLAKGMSAYTARKICKRLVLLPRDIRQEKKGFRDLTRVILNYTPLWEPLKPGHLFADLTGTEKLWGKAPDAADRLQNAIRDTFSLSCRIGAATNKMIARMAARSITCGHIQSVSEGQEPSFIAGFPATTLPCMQGVRYLEQLQALNINRIQQIQELSMPQVTAAFGKIAWTLHQQAQGRDPSPVHLPCTRPVIQAGKTLDHYENDDAVLLPLLRELLDQCLFRLRAQNRLVSCLKLRITYADGQIIIRQKALRPPTAWRHIVLPVLTELFYQTVQRRVQIKGMSLSLQRLSESGQEQLELWQLDSTASWKPEQCQALEQALDHLHQRQGWHAIRIGL